jgi:type IV secretion system protein VirD4
LRREPGLERHKDIAPEPIRPPLSELKSEQDETDDEALRVRLVGRNMRQVARQVALDPGDRMDL